MPQFLEFSENCELYRSLARYGRRNAPLQLIGTFLSYAVNAMLNNIMSEKSSTACKDNIGPKTTNNT